MLSFMQSPQFYLRKFAQTSSDLSENFAYSQEFSLPFILYILRVSLFFLFYILLCDMNVHTHFVCAERRIYMCGSIAERDFLQTREIFGLCQDLIFKINWKVCVRYVDDNDKFRKLYKTI